MGIIVCCRKIIVAFLQRHKSVQLWFIPLAYFAVQYLFILALMKLNWDRYYLPAVIAGRILIGIGIYAIASLIISKFRQRVA